MSVPRTALPLRARRRTPFGRVARALPAALVVWLGATAGARADTATITRFFDDQAREAFAARRYPAALQYFLLVDRATPSPGAAYNVAVTAQTTGDLKLAFAYLASYLESDDQDAARREDADRRATTLRAGLALVRVESDPPGATLYVDQREYGSYGTTPRTIAVDPGEHKLLLDLAGHHSTTTSVVAKKAEQAAVRAALAPRTGQLRIETTPADAPVEIRQRGKTVRTAVGGKAIELPIGRYELHIEPAGFRPGEDVAVVEEGITGKVAMVARPIEPKTGKLLVTTGALGAALYLDGKHVATTPATLPAVPEGKHRLEVRAKGHRPATRTVTIAKDQSVLVTIALSPTVEPAP
jgi:outer membrane receptor for ferrienterochelin and colicins